MSDGTIRWCYDGVPDPGRHRENGPADFDGNGRYSWRLDGIPSDRDTVLTLWLTTHHPETPPETRALIEALADDWRPETTFDDLHAVATAALH